MHGLDKKQSGLSSAAESTITNVVSCSSWGNSTESHASGTLNLKMGAPDQHLYNNKGLSLRLQDPDTTSTGQSYLKAASVTDGNFNGQNVISAPSNVTQGFFFPLQVDNGHPVACLPLPFSEPYFGGMVAAASYGSQTMIHPHMMAMFPGRVPLPLDLPEDEPIFVNAKQYRAILRRREYRAKLESQNKLLKDRKPYLHESRHVHALKRARGAGGRFLKTKITQDSSFISGVSGSGVVESRLQPLNYRNDVSAASCSNVVAGSHSDDIFYQHQDFRFTGYPSYNGMNMQRGGFEPGLATQQSVFGSL